MLMDVWPRLSEMKDISVPLFFSTVANECRAEYVENGGIPRSAASVFIAALHDEITFRTRSDTSSGFSFPFACRKMNFSASPLAQPENELFGFAFGAVTASRHYFGHQRGERRMNDLALFERMCRLRTDECDLAVADVLIFKENHVAEVDAVTQI